MIDTWTSPRGPERVDQFIVPAREPYNGEEFNDDEGTVLRVLWVTTLLGCSRQVLYEWVSLNHTLHKCPCVHICNMDEFWGMIRSSGLHIPIEVEQKKEPKKMEAPIEVIDAQITEFEKKLADLRIVRNAEIAFEIKRRAEAAVKGLSVEDVVNLQARVSAILQDMRYPDDASD